VAFASFTFELVKPDTTFHINLKKDSKKMSMRKKIHLNRTIDLFLRIIPGGKGKYDELN
jgi:hypothetical protein